jgi:hypothetical protein
VGRINFNPELQRKFLPKDIADSVTQATREQTEGVPYFAAVEFGKCESDSWRNENGESCCCWAIAAV